MKNSTTRFGISRSFVSGVQNAARLMLLFLMQILLHLLYCQFPPPTKSGGRVQLSLDEPTEDGKESNQKMHATNPTIQSWRLHFTEESFL